MTGERQTRRNKDLGALQELLLRAAPPGQDASGNPTTPSITTLAKALELSSWAVYVWINKNRVPANRVRAIVALSEGRVSIQDFHDYTYL